MPNIFFLSQIPVATLLVAWLCYYGIRKGRPIMPFACAVGLFLLVLGAWLWRRPEHKPPQA